MSRSPTPAPNHRIGRRGFLRAVVLVPMLAVFMMALGPGDQLVVRKARFIERGDDVLVELDVPELFPPGDREALLSLDSGFDTRLVFDIGVFKTYQRAPIRVVHREVQIWHNQWASPSRYEVTVTDDGRKRKPKYFASRDEAVAAAVHLRVRIASVEDLGRGRDATHYVRISALRNPIGTASTGGAAENRERDQDVAYFRKWISIFVRSRIRAEVALDIRAQPNFYLEPLPGPTTEPD